MTDQLVITNLQKRLLSSIEAFARTLAVHQRTREARRQRADDARLETLRGGVEADSDWAELADEEVFALEEAADPWPPCRARPWQIRRRRRCWRRWPPSPKPTATGPILESSAWRPG